MKNKKDNNEHDFSCQGEKVMVEITEQEIDNIIEDK